MPLLIISVLSLNSDILLDDFAGANCGSYDLTHLDEILSLHDLKMDILGWHQRKFCIALAMPTSRTDAFIITCLICS